MKTDNRTKWFKEARFGLFIHYGLYSLLERGEWVMNREKIASEKYGKLAKQFTAEKFDADFICDLAVKAGMKYIVLTTMHHDGFRLYDSKLSDYNSVKSAAKRDLTGEFIAAARKRGLRIGLYHSLNNWFDQPDAVAALENKADYDVFIKNTFDRIEELVSRYNPIDIMWYDGWWPFNAAEWQSERMNRMVSAIQPHIIFNGRNGLPGDFGTPENHITAPSPWRPWEANMTFNDHWGYYKYDTNWKSPETIIGMLAKVAAGKGNLMLNIGPKGDGSVPGENVKILERLGAWMDINAECVRDTDLFTFNLREKGDHRSDFIPHGDLTAKGNYLYIISRYWPGIEYVISGLECKVEEVHMLDKVPLKIKFRQENDKLSLLGLPEKPPVFCPVFKLKCDRPPVMYCTGGMRNPQVPHPHYDPCPSDIML